MRNFLGTTKVILTIVAAMMILMASSSPPRAETGSVRISVAKAGFIGGVSLGAIGAAKAGLIGHAYNLRSPEDTAGTYSAVTASVVVAGGGKVARLQNAKGVVLELRGAQIGLELSTAISGIDISLR